MARKEGLLWECQQRVFNNSKSIWPRFDQEVKCYRHLKAHKRFILGDKYDEITCRASQKYFQSSEFENLAAERVCYFATVSLENVQGQKYEKVSGLHW